MTEPSEKHGPAGPAAVADAAARLLALFESRIAPALERIADALERGSLAAPEPDGRGAAVAEIRRAIRDGELSLAGSLLADLGIDFPDAAESSALTDELDAARREAISDHRMRLDAARAASDADAVLSYRNELADLLDPAALQPIDKDVLAWLMALLMKRMRTGTVRTDVAQLAARIAESFPHRPEGASLRASLPTIRRSAGLCARCAEPYLGVEDSCPQCQAGIPRIADLPETPSSPT